MGRCLQGSWWGVLCLKRWCGTLEELYQVGALGAACWVLVRGAGGQESCPFAPASPHIASLLSEQPWGRGHLSRFTAEEAEASRGDMTGTAHLHPSPRPELFHCKNGACCVLFDQ